VWHTSQDVTIGQIILGAYKFSTKMVKVSIELIQDSAFSLEEFLKQQFAIRLGRYTNKLFTTGSGSSQPNGLLGSSGTNVATVGVGDGASYATIGNDNATTPDPRYRLLDGLCRRGPLNC